MGCSFPMVTVTSTLMHNTGHGFLSHSRYVAIAIKFLFSQVMIIAKLTLILYIAIVY